MEFASRPFRIGFTGGLLRFYPASVQQRATRFALQPGEAALELSQTLAIDAGCDKPEPVGLVDFRECLAREGRGAMRKLFRDSVRSSYTVPELQRMIEYSPLRGVRIFKRGSSHIGFERPIAP